MNQIESAQTVVVGRVTFPNAETANAELTKLLAGGEHLKVRAARVVQAIRDQELFREEGYESFNAYLPLLLERTASIGWGAERTVRQYLALVDVLADQLGFDDAQVVRAVSHLGEVLKLVEREKSGEIAQHATKEGKCDAPVVEAVASLVIGYVIPPQDVAALADAESARVTVQRITGQSLPAVPHPESPKGASWWSLSDTKALVETLQKKKPPVKYTLVVAFKRLDNGSAEVEELGVVGDDGTKLQLTLDYAVLTPAELEVLGAVAELNELGG